MPEYFFIVGAMRTGTTYLSTLLDEHSEIEMAKPFSPEPKYFINRSLNESFDEEDYTQSFFKETTPIRGEKTVFYNEIESVIQYISTYLPNSKIIYILRDPILRAISNYNFTVENGGGVESLDINQALTLEAEQRCEKFDNTKFTTCPVRHIGKGEYINKIEMLHKYFPKEQVLILIHEEIIGNLNAIQSVYNYVGASSDFIPTQLNNFINAGVRLKANKIEEMISAETLDYLKRHFKSFNDRLYKYLDRKVEHWIS